MRISPTASRLAGRVAMVTGGGQGLGLAYVQRLASEGATVVAVDLVQEAAEAVGTAVPGAIGVAGDVRNFADMRRCADLTVERFGSLDILVNNAGGGMLPRRPFAEVSEEHWSLVFDVNLKGAWQSSRAAAPYMRRQKWGRIVNVASSGVNVSRSRNDENTPYLAAKYGVIGLTRSLARELGPFNVTVNVISPGATAVATRKLSRSPAELRERFERIIERQVIRRPERPEDLAAAVAFLASDDAEFISGQLLAVDGGWTMP